MRKHYKTVFISFHGKTAENCPWDLVSIKYRTHLCNILPKLRHLTKIGYSSRFVYNFSQGRADVVRARLNSTIFVRIPSRVNWVKLV